MNLGRWSRIAAVASLALALAISPAIAAKKKSSTPKHAKPAAAAPAANAAPVDLNSATMPQLVALPGIGAATARKIVAGRPYHSVAELSKAGIAAATIKKITPMVTVGAAVAPAAAVTPAPAKTPRPHLSRKPAVASAATAPASMPAPASAPAANPTASAMTPAATARASTPAPGGGNGQVWVNLDSKVYHYSGDRWYGTSKHGQYMNEQDAIKAGYRAAKTKVKTQ